MLEHVAERRLRVWLPKEGVPGKEAVQRARPKSMHVMQSAGDQGKGFRSPAEGAGDECINKNHLCLDARSKEEVLG